MNDVTTSDLGTSYLHGERLYGDAFTELEIERWFAEEAEGYANLGAKDAEAYEYSYHALNWYHGWRHLPDRPFGNVLGFGSAYGHELEPIARRAKSITIVDPSDAFVHSDLNGTPLTYVKPQASGDLPFPDATFDLITCSGVLHHIPNVSHVFNELARVLAPGGYMLLREPIISMGDWRKPRPGLTKNERGIPIRMLRRMVHRTQNELRLVREAPCFARAIQLGALRLRINPYASRTVTMLDAWYSRIAGLRRPYHATRSWQKLLPIGVFYVLQKAAH